MNENNLQNLQHKENHKSQKRVKYSLLTFVLIICIIELLVSNVNNINKNVNFISKIHGLEHKRNEEMDKNQQLKSEIANFNSEITLESIARNNLKMAGKNEILIIINKPDEQKDKELKVSHKWKKDKKKK
jgi:cell division protein FtsL